MATGGVVAATVIGSGGLLLSLVTFVRNERRNHRRDLKEDHADTERRSREAEEQATKVFAYLEPEPDLFWTMVVENRSEAPVWALQRCFVDKRHPENVSYGHVEDLESLPPKGRVTLTSPTTYLDKNVAVWISFRDAAGRWWVRDSFGVLDGPRPKKPSRPPWDQVDRARP